MRNKKSGFFAFLFSLIPGAGEMYMGFFKQGVSIMGLCVLLGFVGSTLGIGELLLFVPILWFYSFFHVHHLRGLPPEEFYAVEDRWLFFSEEDISMTMREEKNKRIGAIVLIVIGVWLLWKVFTDTMLWIVPDFLREAFWEFQNALPRVIIAVVILYAGVCMLRGKKILPEERTAYGQRSTQEEKNEERKEQGGE